MLGWLSLAGLPLCFPKGLSKKQNAGLCGDLELVNLPGIDMPPFKVIGLLGAVGNIHFT